MREYNLKLVVQDFSFDLCPLRWIPTVTLFPRNDVWKIWFFYPLVIARSNVRCDVAIKAIAALFFCQVNPIWVQSINECKFFLSRPTFDLLFSCYCFFCRIRFFDIDKFVSVVFFRKTVNTFWAMFVRSSHYVVGYACVENAVCMICQNVNPHCVSLCACGWILTSLRSLRMTRGRDTRARFVFRYAGFLRRFAPRNDIWRIWIAFSACHCEEQRMLRRVGQGEAAFRYAGFPRYRSEWHMEN